MTMNAAQKRKALGATKRRQPLPWAAFFRVMTWVAFIGAGIIAAVFVVRFLLSLPWQEWQFTVLPVHQIDMEPALVFQEQAAVQQISDAYMGQSLITLDVNAFRADVIALPWVADAVVRKVWPGQLRVVLTEHQPIARWNGRYVLNSEGQPLQQPAALLQLAELNGPEGQADKVMEHYLQFVSAIKEANTELTSVTLFPRGAWQLETQEGITISLGVQEVLERSRRVVDVLIAHEGRIETIESIDARYVNGVAIQYRTESLN